jgi:type VI secretion system protein ImpH
MAPADRRARTDLSVLLLEQPYRFDFFQAVRLLERLAREWAAQDPRRPSASVGRDHLPAQEAARFRTLPSLGFSASAVAGVHAPDPATPDSLPPVEMVVPFLGLVGSNGVMPHHYTALLLKRLRDKDFALREFLDLFHHRLVSLFYRAWEKYRLPFAFERFQSEAGSGDDPVTTGLYCLVGLGTAGLRGRLEVEDAAFLYYAGHFAHLPRCAVSLEALLRDYFEMGVEVQALHGQWLDLGEGETAALAGEGRPGGRHNSMGRDLIVGRRVWDVQSKFRLRVGPLSYAQFRRLMPSGDGLRPLWQMTRTYVGPELDFDVQPVLKAAEVPPCQLTRHGERPRLGWNTWIHARALPRDVDDAVFKLQEL